MPAEVFVDAREVRSGRGIELAVLSEGEAAPRVALATLADGETRRRRPLTTLADREAAPRRET